MGDMPPTGPALEVPMAEDPGAVFDAHVRAEFAERSVDATMATMTDAPYVTHVPLMTGGYGRRRGAPILRHLVHRPLACRRGDNVNFPYRGAGSRDRRDHCQLYTRR